MTQAFICDAIRTPIGRYGGALSGVRADDLGAIPLKALMERNPQVDWTAVDDIIYGCANQAGEDNRNVARMSGLLAGLPIEVPGTTVNRLCGSGMDAVGLAARSIKAGEATLMLAGGVESMSRAPFVMGKAESAFSRNAAIYDTTIGWRFVNPAMKKLYETHSMPQTADNVAADFSISRADQDAFAIRSQQRWGAADAAGRFADELVPVVIPQKKGDPKRVDRDEHPRPETTLEQLAKLKGVNGPELTVTAGNASGVNDGACALLIASETAAGQYGLKPFWIVRNEPFDDREWVNEKIPPNGWEIVMKTWAQGAQFIADNGGYVGFPDGPCYPLNPFESMKAYGLQWIFDEGKGYYTGHHYGKNRPRDYPYDPVTRYGAQLTEEAYRRLLDDYADDRTWWEEPMDLINQRRRGGRGNAKRHEPATVDLGDSRHAQ